MVIFFRVCEQNEQLGKRGKESVFVRGNHGHSIEYPSGLLAAQPATTEEVAANTGQACFWFFRFIQARQYQLQHAFGNVTMTLCDRQNRTLKEVEKFVIPEGGDHQIDRQTSF